MKKEKIINTLKVIALALVLTAGTAYATSTWTQAPSNPPNGNVDAPINVGNNSQSKLVMLEIVLK